MEFEVYIHVPFCLRRCGYCDFNTYTATDLGGGASRANYANMVIREMALVRDWQRAHGIEEPAASTVFFGGGTPTILPADDLAAMLEAIRSTWGIAPDAEITTEANPDTVNEYYIGKLAEAGFTRISFGMQSAVPHVLRTLDRTHTPANVEAGVAAAAKAGLRSSVDLIYGAPGESLDDWRTSVETAIGLGVNHISAYALTVEPTTKMGRQIKAGILPKPNDDDEAAKYEIADEAFSAAGLSWYEVSNWARPGYESRHNLGYWRNVDWAGLGPGAHSHYNAVAEKGDGDDADHPQSAAPTAPAGGGGDGLSRGGDHGTHGLRGWDIAHPRLWGVAINEGRVPWSGSESITAEENLEEIIMLGLRIREGLDLDRVNRLIRDGREAGTLGPSITALDRTRFEPLVDEGLVTLDGDRVVPTRAGRLLNDTIIERCFAWCGL
ncbi:MAG: radical SAM family heme chaperone HemW [Bifidobacterium scardovii]|uniref:radical SAM family heme chaperone HemW n=1 Tax=Bifidobacterium scardovii TaxID=158787 RepID=UPI0006678626|nr:radical SAM family heme chaperone HemW [Bifidobacterium scardovii]MBS6948974.1 coproporphyrinogen III oxidase [Bifidobacterium scardovii]MDU3737628.1 radical SAM family heme chaperone HemW [Bifidobacterium scardovii]MDU5298256.1 radical SAM family heme chaperone HemW [Bifidobacterium scardovii]MDU5610455.1 radical SAM family heme chaperone HemW [Bifidobacterium scardovii]MDU5887727.1 radical SAM family heme chaperone HemW [Bifidobacterium scardovii]